MSSPTKVVIFGLDGATWAIITPLVASGLLPTFKKLMEHGVWADMPSVIPPGTPSAWSSIVTGVNPGKHGFFNFSKLNSDYSYCLCLSDTLKARALWDYMDDSNRRSLFINYPTSYPPPKINGVVVSGMQTPGLHSEFTHPLSVKDDILQNLPDYVIDLEFRAYGQGQRFLRALCHAAEQRLLLLKHLTGKAEYDLTCLVITETDRLQHLYWNEKALGRFYAFLDEMLSEIVSECQRREASLFVVSDHGFGKVKRQICLNRFLEQKGYLRYRTRGENAATKLRYRIHDLGLDPVVNVMPLGLRMALKERFMESHAQRATRIDWGQTRAFTTTSPLEVFINSRRRFAQGTVSEEETQETKTRIMGELDDWVDAETGDRPLEAVYDGSLLYPGSPYTHDLGDIVVLPSTKKGYALTPHYQEKVIVKGHKDTGNHDVPGIFLAYGDSIEARGNLGTVGICDVAPTILHMFGLPIPSNMDGRVLTEIFAEDSDPARRAISYQRDDQRERLRGRIRTLKATDKI